MRTPGKLSPGLIAVLVTREHSRLSGQIKSLDKLLQAPYSDKQYQRLQTMSANWRALLAHDGAAKLADAVDAFILFPAVDRHKTAAKLDWEPVSADLESTSNG